MCIIKSRILADDMLKIFMRFFLVYFVSMDTQPLNNIKMARKYISNLFLLIIYVNYNTPNNNMTIIWAK